jgi:two-component system, cell cycle sensor histidine kinase PleC
VGNDKYEECAKNILDAGEHLLGIINDLLNVSQIEMGQLQHIEEEVDVRHLMTTFHTLVKGRATQSGLRMALQMDDTPTSLVIDEMRVKQVLLNLVSNAIKFTPEGGTITLSANKDTKGRLVLSVADTGRGIDTDKLTEELVNIGQSGDPYIREVQGAGIGLPLSRKLVEPHGGTNPSLRPKTFKGTNTGKRRLDRFRAYLRIRSCHRSSPG